jgi:hypothetical protein
MGFQLAEGCLDLPLVSRLPTLCHHPMKPTIEGAQARFERMAFVCCISGSEANAAYSSDPKGTSAILPSESWWMPQP